MLESIERFHHFQTFVTHAWVGEEKVYRVHAGVYPTQGAARKAMQDMCTTLDVSDCWLDEA
jgi:hypothetical protein